MSTDVKHRVLCHNGKGRRPGAKYTRSRRPVKLLASTYAGNRVMAGRAERWIKSHPHQLKLEALECVREFGILGWHSPGPRTHCPRGHEYTPANTEHRETGRRCRTCHRNQERERQRKKRS